MLRFLSAPAVLFAAMSPTASPLHIPSSRFTVQARPSHRMGTQVRSKPSHHQLKKTAGQRTMSPPSAFALTSHGLDKYLDALFDRADTNHNGAVSIEETYELVLKMYVKINREAPVAPPSKETVDELFRRADLNKDGSLGRDEFKRLSLVLASRASVRIIAFKAVKFLAAPLLAWKLVRYMAGQSWSWPERLAKAIVPERFLPVVLKSDLWATVFTVTFVVSMGNIVLGSVNYVLDALYMRKEKEPS